MASKRKVLVMTEADQHGDLLDALDAKIQECERLDAENTRLKQDLACRDGGLGLIYSIREALGFNKLYPLSNLDDNARLQRVALLACAPIAFATFEHEKVRNEFIGATYPDNDQPIEVTIRTTLGAIREARRALWVADIAPGTKVEAA